MPATNFTQKLKLGIYQGNDSISPLVTGNENMEKIDAFAQGVDNQFAITQNQVNTNTTNIEVNAEGITDLDGRVKVIEGKVPDYDANLVTVAGLAGEVDTLQTDMATAKTDIVNVTQEANTNTTNITNINAKLAEELPFPLAIETEGGENKYGWKPSVSGTFTPFAPVPPFNLATQGEGEDKQYGYTNDAGKFVPFESGAYDYYLIGWGNSNTTGITIVSGAYDEYDIAILQLGSSTSIIDAEATVTRNGSVIETRPLAISPGGVQTKLYICKFMTKLKTGDVIKTVNTGISTAIATAILGGKKVK